MARQFTMHPVKTGSSKTLIVGGKSAPTTGGGVGDGGNAQFIPDLFQVRAKSNLAVAPFPVSFEPNLDLLSMFGIDGPAEGEVYDARWHDPAFVYTYGESYPYGAPINASFKQSGTSIGAEGTHIYRTPGPYKPRLDVYYYVGGTLVHVYGELDVEVASPETVFAGDRTIFVSPSSNWTYCPAGAIQTTSLTDAVKATRATWDAPSYKKEDHLPMRIMLNRGETWSLTSDIEFWFNTPWVKPVHVVAGPGPGADPIINRGFTANANDEGTLALSKTLDIAIQGLDMRGPGNPVTGTSPDGIPTEFEIKDGSPNSFLVDKCRGTGFAGGIHAHGGLEAAKHRKIFMNDWVFENYLSSGGLVEHFHHFSVTGCRINSHPDSPINNVAGGGWGFRIGGEGPVTIIDSTDFYIGQGWSGLDGGYVATQASLRLAFTLGGHRILVTRNGMENGYDSLGIGHHVDAGSPINALVDSNYLLGSYQTSSQVGTKSGGVTIRNNINVIPDSVRLAGSGSPSHFIGLNSVGSSAENEGAPINIYNNTFIDLHGGMLIHKFSEVNGVPVPFDSVTIENNLLSTVDGPLVESPVRWLPRTKGYKTLTAYNPETATPADVVWHGGIPTDSPLIGTATGKTAILDYTGALRGANPSRGALEPA